MRSLMQGARSCPACLVLTVILAFAGHGEAQTVTTRPDQGELLQRRCQLGYVLLWNRDYAAAQQEFRRVLESSPQHDEARLGLALAIERQAASQDPPSDNSEALRLMEQIGEGSPQFPEALAGRARILVGRQKLGEAIRLYEKLKERSLLTDDYRLAYAEALAWDRQYDAALRELGPLRHRPQPRPEVVKLEGQILAWSGQVEEALPKLREALKANPTDDQLRMDLATALLGARKPDEALEVLKGLSPAAADGVKATNLHCDILASQKKHPQAIELLKTALKKHPGNVSLQIRLAELLSWNSQLEEAIAIYRKVLTARPDQSQVRIKLAETLSWAGRFDEAATEFRKALGDLDTRNAP